MPYLNVIEYTNIKTPSTAVLAFTAGKIDMTIPYFLRIPQLKDVQSQLPQAHCEVTPTGGVNSHLLVSRETLQRQPPGRHLARQIALFRIRRGGDRVKDWEDLRCAGP